LAAAALAVRVLAVLVLVAVEAVLAVGRPRVAVVVLGVLRMAVTRTALLAVQAVAALAITALHETDSLGKATTEERQAVTPLAGVVAVLMRQRVPHQELPDRLAVPGLTHQHSEANQPVQQFTQAAAVAPGRLAALAVRAAVVLVAVTQTAPMAVPILAAAVAQVAMGQLPCLGQVATAVRELFL
jgi:hypothetical protein